MTNEKIVAAVQSGTGDRAALLEQLYVQNAGMIEKIIRRYSGVEEMEDLRQESFFGLMKAAQLWKPDKENMFFTYAAYWIRAFEKRMKAKARNTLEATKSATAARVRMEGNAKKC